jgi:hypothetical protein
MERTRLPRLPLRAHTLAMRLRPTLPAAALFALFTVSAGAGATCYTVYGPTGKDIVFRSTEPPVNMARDLHETLPARFGAGSSMVFSLENTGNCSGIGAGTDQATGATTGYMVGGGSNSRTLNASYIRSDVSDSRPTAADLPASGRTSGFGTPTGAFSPGR